MIAGGHADRNELTALIGDDPNLAVGIGEIDAQRFLAGLGELNHLCFEDHTIDRNIDHRDHCLQLRNLVGRAA